MRTPPASTAGVTPIATFPPEATSSPGPHCRVGVTAPNPVKGYDIRQLNVGALLDWRMGDPPTLPFGVQYIHVIRLRDQDYEALTDEALRALVQDNPGAYWLIGNEPDTTYENQDGLLPEVYAARYYRIAGAIRALDPDARLGFGTVVQPTPIRIRYLERAWQQLIELAGGQAAASALIDFWSIHAFILNEWPEEWGTGIPPGFEEDYADAVHITDSPYTATVDVDTFRERIENFRSWMASIGEREKPLWITEFGSLFPPLDPPGGPDFLNLPEAATGGYLFATFDYLFQARDPNIGLPADENRLVQRWFWYSLNDHLYRFGGSLYDPDRDGALTVVGMVFLQYMQQLTYGVDLHLYRATPAGDGSGLDVAIGNSGSTTYKGWVTLQAVDPEGNLLGSIRRLVKLQGCGDATTLHLADVPADRPFTLQLILKRDVNLQNNTLTFTP